MDKAIREGLQRFKPGSEYDNLYQAAKERSESDFLIGINTSQALSVAHDLLPLPRQQELCVTEILAAKGTNHPR